MDEYNTGMDPEVKRYFRKIISSLSYGLMWLMAVVTAGIFFHLAEISGGVMWYNLVFYGLALITFLLLLRCLYRVWGGK